jgi:hypothetical protein
MLFLLLVSANRQVIFQRFSLDSHFKLFGENCMKIITIGQIYFFSTNYQVFLKLSGKFIHIFLRWNISSNKFELMTNF